MQSVHSGLPPSVSILLCGIVVLGINLATWRLSGFPQLIRHYGWRSSFVGSEWYWQSVAIGWLSYRSCVTVGLNTTGLYMAPWAIFRAGHPPLLIPWSELQVEGSQWWWLMRVYPLRTKACPNVVIRIPQQLFHQLVRASDGRLAGGFD